MECIKSSSKRDVHSNKYLKKKQTNSKTPNFTPQGTRKRTANEDQTQ